MKTLNQDIMESIGSKTALMEGLADWDEGDFEKSIKKETSKATIKKQIIDWVIENTTDRVFKNHFEFDTTTTPWTVDYYNGAALYFSPKVSSINGNGLFQWGKVYCMRIYNNQNIENFEGGPKKVNTLQIKNCPKFESLEDGPEEVDYLLQILNCPEFKILPQIKEAFYIRIENCPKLEYLNGCADEVNEFKIIDSGLKSLKGGPKKAYDYLVSKNKLTSLEGGPEEVISDFVIDDNPIKSLKGGPKKANRYLCNNTQITSLEGGPKKVNIFGCNNCDKLSSLKGIEDSDIYSIYCGSTPITSLKYCPDVKILDCKDTKLENLKFLPKSVTNLSIDGVKSLKSLDGLHSDVKELSMRMVPFMGNIKDYNIRKVFFK